MTKYENIF